MKWETARFAKKMRKAGDQGRFPRVEKAFKTTAMGNGTGNELKIDN